MNEPDPSAVPGLRIPGLPSPLRWLVPAPSFEVTASGALRMEAGPQTDWFIDPGGRTAIRNAPALVMPAAGPWQLSAVVSADHQATFDAGVLFVHVDDSTWAKLCLELSPQGQVMVVSVVTRGASDDCNSLSVEGHRLHLRISGTGTRLRLPLVAGWPDLAHGALLLAGRWGTGDGPGRLHRPVADRSGLHRGVRADRPSGRPPGRPPFRRVVPL